MWLSADPAMGEYVPAPGKGTDGLPGMGGVFNTVNLHVFAYAGNNPIRYKDPDGRHLNDLTPQASEAAIRREEQAAYTKEKISITVQRNVNDNENNGEWYRSELSVVIDDVVVFSAPVQSTADHPQLNQPATADRAAGPIGWTLPAGEYRARLLNSSYSYLNAIQIRGDFLIHPDLFTTEERRNDRKKAGLSVGPWNQPYSAGCQILEEKNFNTLIEVLHSLGFEVGDGINVKINGPVNYVVR
jgi:hypothetical protein